MKKIKKIVLSFLLFTFAFILVHDYAMIDIQSDSSYELTHLECEDSAVELTLHLHDTIHSLLLDPLVEIVSISLLSPYQKQLESRDFFTSYTDSVPQRPPLS